MVYAYATEWRDKKERERFDRELLAGESGQVSHGTSDLMKIMGVRPPTPRAA